MGHPTHSNTPDGHGTESLFFTLNTVHFTINFVNQKPFWRRTSCSNQNLFQESKQLLLPYVVPAIKFKLQQDIGLWNHFSFVQVQVVRKIWFLRFFLCCMLIAQEVHWLVVNFHLPLYSHSVWTFWSLIILTASLWTHQLPKFKKAFSKSFFSQSFPPRTYVPKWRDKV